MRKAFLLIAMLVGFVGVRAQIPAEVTDVMNHCRAAMVNPSGLEYEMDIKTGMGPISMKIHLVVAKKGNLKRSHSAYRLMGVDIENEAGFDGTESWEIKHSTNRDTIIITHDNSKKDEEYIQLDLDKKYNKAKMKHKDGFYEITFSEPKDKSSEIKSITVKISEKNYTMREIRSGARGAKVTMTITKIRVGLRDSHFKLDLSQHPNAVVIRK